MRISDWSSDVCSSDLHHGRRQALAVVGLHGYAVGFHDDETDGQDETGIVDDDAAGLTGRAERPGRAGVRPGLRFDADDGGQDMLRREPRRDGDSVPPGRGEISAGEDTCETQSLMRNRY